MADLASKMKDAVFILYVIVILVITLFVIIYVAPRYGRSNILVYISVCSLIGSFSVISVKGLGLAIKETIGGSQQFTNTLTWFWLIAVIACVSVQLVSERRKVGSRGDALTVYMDVRRLIPMDGHSHGLAFLERH